MVVMRDWGRHCELYLETFTLGIVILQYPLSSLAQPTDPVYPSTKPATVPAKNFFRPFFHFRLQTKRLHLPTSGDNKFDFSLKMKGNLKITETPDRWAEAVKRGKGRRMRKKTGDPRPRASAVPSY